MDRLRVVNQIGERVRKHLDAKSIEKNDFAGHLPSSMPLSSLLKLKAFTIEKEYNAALGLFYVELPDGTVLSHTLEENEVFPAQFGREIMSLMTWLFPRYKVVGPSTIVSKGDEGRGWCG